MRLPKRIQFISWLILIILGVGSLCYFKQAVEMISNTNYINSGQLKGVTANRNIAKFSVIKKFHLYSTYIIYQKKIILRFIYLVIVFASILSLSMIQSLEHLLLLLV